jgi:hypothetical protein
VERVEATWWEGWLGPLRGEVALHDMALATLVMTNDPSTGKLRVVDVVLAR